MFRRKSPTQTKIKFRTWGGLRQGAGRKVVNGEKPCISHHGRASLTPRHPVHVTLRARGRLPSLREQVLFFALRRCMSEASRDWFRVLQFSVQSDHVHLVVEARDRSSLRRGTAGLEIRAALRLNRILRKRGSFWGDRYHARAMKTPLEVRHGLVYVLMNWKKHAPDAANVDPFSSARAFAAWTVPLAIGPPPALSQSVEPPMTWLLRKGWKKHGLVDARERPRDAR